MKRALYFTAASVLSLWLVSPAVTLAFAATDEDTEAFPVPPSKNVDELIRSLQKQSARLSAQEQKLALQQKELEEQKRTLTDEMRQFEQMQAQLAQLTGKHVTLASATPSTSAKTIQTAAVEPSSTGATPAEVGTERKESKDKPPEVPVIIDEGGVLAGKGKLVVTPELEYDRSSATAVEISGFSIVPALNIGVFDISKVNRDLVTPSLDLRYGLTNRFEIEAKVPYVWRQDSTLGRAIGAGSSQNSLTSVNGSDIGDVEFGAHYQMNKGENGWPYLIGNLRFKTATGTSPFEMPVVNGLEQKLPTGSGFYALQPSVTAIFPSDPVVYYANVGYLHNFSRSFPTYGQIEPGDGFNASMGMSLSLNDKTSFSVGYSHEMLLKTLQNGAAIPNSTVLQVGSLDIGYSYNLTDRTNINFTVSAGVTSDAPDVRLMFRIPMTFDLL